MLRGNRNLLRRTDIKTRLTLAFIFVPLCLMIVFFLIYYSFSTTVIRDKNEQASAQMVTMSEEIFHLNANALNEQIDNLAASTYLRNYLYYPADTAMRRAFSHNLHDNDLLAGKKGLQLYDETGKLLYEEGTLFPVDLKAYKAEIQAQKQGGYWLYDNEAQMIMLTREIRDLYDQPLGYVFCSFAQEAFNASLSQSTQAGSHMLVVDANGQVLFGSNPDDIKEIIDLQASTVEINQHSYYMSDKKIEGTPWYVVYLNDENYVLEEIHNFRNMLVAYGIVFFVLLAAIAYFVYHSIYDPVHNILYSMRTLDENNLAMNRVEDDGRDEIHELSINFNDLLDRVQELLHTVHQEQEQKRETQFQLLQAQINPHFLFNTLNTLHYLAILNEDKPVSEGITALARLLRNTIVDSKEVVTVEEEIENLKNYIIIQKLRYGDVFETVYNIDDNVRSCAILKFLLQPIAENSILHAFEEDREHQILTIRAKAEGKYLKIEIGDNGKGFALDMQENRNKKLSGIGIGNIQERIRLMYGEDYSMDIQSVVGTGTIVTLLLPFKKTEGR
ncbi:histidine kinase [[Clostridium] innocuum]|nr:histidine kinase [[Clostridium] innocuum]